MKNKVVALNQNGITPELVLNSLHSELPNIKHLYVVAMTNDNEPLVYSSTDLAHMCMAAVIFQDYAQRVMRGEIESD